MPAKELLSDVFVQTLEQAIDGVVVINSKNDIILYNQAAEQLWEYTQEEVLGKNVSILVPNHIKSNHDSYVNANRETGVNKIVGTSIDVEINCKSATKKWGSMSISRVQLDGKIFYTAFIKDITEAYLERKRIEMLSLVTDKTDNAIFITDKNWKIVYINSGFTSILGYQEQDVEGLSPTNLISPHITPDQISDTRQSLCAGQAMKFEELYQKKTGEKLWCSVMCNPVFDEDGELAHTVTILSEITSAKLHQVLHSRMLNAIARDESLESVMLSACHEVSSILDDVTVAIFQAVDNRYLKLLAAPKLENSPFSIIHKLDIKEGAASSGTAAFRGEAVLVTDIDTDPLWADYKENIMTLGYKGSWSNPIKDNKGETIGVIAFYRKNNIKPNDLDYLIIRVLSPLCALAIEREKQRENIRHLAYYDSLTNLPNRRLLHEKAEKAIRNANINQQSLAVLLLDLDRFKLINDSFGHPAGDKLLIEIGSRLNDKCSNTDICGRLSGDEFVLVIIGKTVNELNSFIESLRSQLCQTADLGGTKLNPSASIGISVFPEDGEDFSTLLHRADMAMYQAKTSGQGRFAFFSHKLNHLAQERQFLEKELKKAIDNEELEIHYQPQIYMNDGRLYGVEALSRWNHPQLGEILPSKFIPLAEECGLIGDLSRWALRTACKQMSIWRHKGVDIPAVSVNLSPLNFHNINLCTVVKDEIKKHNLKPSDLRLELTESVLLDNTTSTMEALHELNGMGVSFAIDDFGTGYSSLSYLRKIPIKELKLDRSFVSEIDDDETSQALSLAVLQIGKSMNLDVVAEGIERLEQYTVLKEQGYHVAQGYYFSKALSACKVEAWIEKSKNIVHLYKGINDVVSK
jgi:diguanylate cyclase (GGDEF)-like protein/PAS domain S-box-containing protein